MTFYKNDNVVYVSQSDAQACSENNTIFSAVLGSCVATCIFDSKSGIGGMNHVLLPSAKNGSTSLDRHGINLMELLINKMLKIGARKHSCVAKIFGGANVALGGSTIGFRNGTFVKEYLANEGIPCIAESLGGTQARRIRFWPTSGRVSQLLLDSADPRVELTHITSDVETSLPDLEPEIWN